MEINHSITGLKCILTIHKLNFNYRLLTNDIKINCGIFIISNKRGI